MGSATRESLKLVQQKLVSLNTSFNNEVASELVEAAVLLQKNRQLALAFGDNLALEEAKINLADKTFSSAQDTTKKIIQIIIRMRWSNADDVVQAIEQAAIRTYALVAGNTNLIDEIIALANLVSSNNELETLFGSSLTDSNKKGAMASILLKDKLSPAAVNIISYAVNYPRNKRIGELFNYLAETIANASGYELLYVKSAIDLNDEQKTKLIDIFSRNANKKIKIAVQIVPELIGGLTIHTSTEVIDASVQRRLADLERQLVS